MNEAVTRHFIQQGSSQDLRVSDESAWYVIRQVWPDASSALSRCEIERKCVSRAEALELAEIYNAPPEPLGALSEWSGIKHDTLYQAAIADPPRLRAHLVGKRWTSTRRAVREYQETLVLKPRK